MGVNEIKGSHSIEIIYFAQFEDSIDDIQLNPEDHSEYLWFAEDELDSIIGQMRDPDDPELLAVRKGFALLRGEKLKD